MVFQNDPSSCITCLDCQRTWCEFTGCKPAPFYFSAALTDGLMPLLPAVRPPCVTCGDVATRDITPKGTPSEERWYECERCECRFAVRFTPLSEARKAS